MSVEYTLEEKLARSRNAVEVQTLELRAYQKRYYELLARHKQLYIASLNWGYRHGYGKART